MRVQDRSTHSKKQITNNGRSKSAVHLLLSLAIVSLATAAAHWPALDARAISFDDDKYLIQNRLVQHPGWDSLSRFFTEVLEPSTVPGYYQPLTMASLMLDCALGGRPDHLRPFHRTSLILHVVNTCLIVLLLHTLFDSLIAATCIGLLFGVHPMTVETIPWIGERKTLLASFFALLSIICYVRYARLSETEGVRGRGGEGAKKFSTGLSYGLCITCYLLALLSKPTSVPLPLCMLLLDYWPLRRLTKRALIEKLPFLTIMIVSAYITYESQKRTATAINPTDWSDPLRIPYVISHNIIFYLRKIIWPTHLTSHYPIPDPLNLAHPDVLIGVIGTFILFAALLISWRWTRACVTGWLYFFIAIFPTLGVIGFTNVIASDKYAYLPAVGLMLPLAYGLSLLLKDTHRIKLATVIACTGVFAGLAMAGTQSYLQKWKDTETLYIYMLSYAPNDPIINLNLGLEFEQQKKTTEALQHYQRAVKFAPHYEGGYYNLGNILLQRGDVAGAIPHLKKAIEINPRLAVAYNALGNAFVRANQPEEAMKAYQQAVQIETTYADARYNLANVLLAQKRTTEAAAMYEQVLEIEPNHPPAHKNLAGVRMREGNTLAAVQHYTRALEYRPDWWDVATTLAMMHATETDPKIRDTSKAVRLAQHAVQRTNRKQPSALSILAVAYAENGQLDQAQKTADEAIQLAEAAGQPALAKELRNRMQKYARP